MSFYEICQKLSQCEDKLSVITLPEIFGYENKEVFITKWLAYLLDASKNGFGNAPLNALLKLAGADSVPEYQEIQITREYHFSKIGIIDLLIETPDNIIGIEHKLWSEETQTNGTPQTKVYYKALQKIAREKKHLICIFLKPQANPTVPACPYFRTVTYTELIHAWKQISCDIQEKSRKKFLFDEFILYAEEKLMKANQTDFPVFSQKAELYQQYLFEIQKAAQEYRICAGRFDAWFLNTFLELASDFQVSITSNTLEKQLENGFLQIVRMKEWRELDFHFELLWQRDKRLCTAREIWIEAHQEGRKSHTRFLKQKFKQAGFPVQDKVLLRSETIQADFSDKEKALQVIGKIAEILASEPFQKCAEVADNFWSKK